MKIIARPSESKPHISHVFSPARKYPRSELASILSHYNKSIDNDDVAQRQIDALAAEGSYCVVTGQQLGFLGGPIYTILKGISCLVHARRLGAVPIFWLATEDHDIGEIDHTYLIDSLGNLKKYQIKFKNDGRFVEDLVLSDHHIEVINQFFEHLKIKTPITFEAGSSYTQTMARLLAHLFRGTGLVFVEPYLLRPLSIPFIESELRNTRDILPLVREAFDFENGTNIFYKNHKGKRRKITGDSSGYYIDDELFLFDTLQQNPEKFSTNVAARPVLQSLLFPTKAYVAGPNEMIYYKKLEKLHRYHDVPMPSLIPRFQATFIPRQIAEYLEKSKLNPWEKIDSLPVDFPSDALHRIHNTLHPRNKPQERILSWWQFQAQTSESLIQKLLDKPCSEASEHLYIYL